MEKGRTLGGIGDAFSDRNFRIYFCAAVASWVGYFVQVVAVAWLTWELTGSTTWLAAMALIDIVPSILLLPYTGAIADRIDRRTIMLVTSALLLIQSSTLAGLSAFGLLSIYPLAVLEFIHAVLIAFMVPAMYGTLPRFVAKDLLSPAIAVTSALTQLAVFAGPALAGWIMVQYGATEAFLVNAFGYFALLGAFLLMRTPSDFVPPEPSKNSVVADIIDGFRYLVTQTPVFRLILMGFIANSVHQGFYHMLPAYSDEILNLGVTGMSAILASMGFGATMAALWIGYRSLTFDNTRLIEWASLVSVVLLIGMIITSHFYLALLIAASIGVFGEFRRTGVMTYIQRTVPENQRGRAMGSLYLVRQAASGLGAVVIGAAAAEFGLQMPILIGCALGIAAWIAAYVAIGRRQEP